MSSKEQFASFQRQINTTNYIKIFESLEFIITNSHFFSFKFSFTNFLDFYLCLSFLYFFCTRFFVSM